MRKISIFLLSFSVLFFFYSCEKTNIEKTLSDEMTEVEYATKNLSKIGKNLVEVSSNPDFKLSLYELVKVRFDGEYNVLVKDLCSSLSSKKSCLAKEFIYGANEENLIQEVLFSDEGNSYYPHIYIPFFDELEEKGLLGESKPVIVITTPGLDDSKESFPGYILNDQDEMVLLDYQITEEIAKNQEVWVVSINERVNNEAKVKKSFSENQGSKKSLTSISLNCKIDKMKVRSHRESWVNGASEVSIRAYIEYWDGLNESNQAVDVGCDRSTSDFTGILIRQFTRSEIENRVEKTINYRLEDNWDVTDFYSDPVIYAFVIFESDIWPTGTKTSICYLANGTPRYFTFRSADTEYAIGTIYGNTNNGQFSSLFADGLIVDQGPMKFNTVLY